MRRDTDRRGSIHYICMRWMHAMDAMCNVLCGYGIYNSTYVVVRAMRWVRYDSTVMIKSPFNGVFLFDSRTWTHLFRPSLLPISFVQTEVSEKDAIAFDRDADWTWQQIALNLFPTKNIEKGYRCNLLLKMWKYWQDRKLSRWNAAPSHYVPEMCEIVIVLLAATLFNRISTSTFQK